MKRWLQGLSITVGVLASMSASAELLDTIVAIVDQEVILLSEIRGQVLPELEKMQLSGFTKEEYDKAASRLMQDTLKESIEAKILYREAVRIGIEVHDSEVENRIETLRSTFKTEEEFMAYLNGVGESISDFRKQLRKRIMAQYMSGAKMRDLGKGVVIAEADVSEHYAQNKQEYLQPQQIRIRQIMLRNRRNTDERTQAIATLETLRESILAGADFEALAKQHSQDPAAADGGLIGWQQRGQLVPAIETATFPLKKGEVSEIVETQFGVHIFRVDDRRDAETIPLKEARSIIEPQLREQEASKLYDKWINDLRQHSNIRVYLNKS